MNTHTQSTIVARPIIIRRGVALLRADERVQSLARPHDPEDRALVGHIAGWELRDFAVGSNFATFFTRHGLAHRQLYLRELPLSILTPSKFTDDQFELCALDAPRTRFRYEHTLRAHLEERYGVGLPESLSLRAAGRWR